jgi:uncharacterized spore protein YtfJ
MEHVIELMQEMMGTLTDTAQSEVVVGDEIVMGRAKIVPLSRVSIGFGGGGGEGEGESAHNGGKNKRHNLRGGKGIGGGGGGGARIRPVGVVVFTETGVRVEGVPDKKGTLDRVFSKIPELIDLAKKHKH